MRICLLYTFFPLYFVLLIDFISLVATAFLTFCMFFGELHLFGVCYLILSTRCVANCSLCC
uniref:Uncharacterized protein n=1 Tax=Rhizophora mucronata TaxID=61149 RepID=A0A2P2N932_RHIMU